MIFYVLSIARTPLKLLLMAVGIMALYAYISGQDMNIVVKSFIEMLIPIKNALFQALRTLLPALLKSVLDLVSDI